MLTVKERDNYYTEAALKELNGTLGENERVLIMDDDGRPIGFSVLALDGKDVLIRQVYVKNEYDFRFFDLLARSTLNFVNLFDVPMTVKVKADDYYKPFGFEAEADGYMYVKSDKITFKGSLCGGH